MERKVKYDFAFKLRCVEEVLNQHYSINSVAKANGVDHRGLSKWISFYIKYGTEGLLTRPKNQNYSLDFKLEVIKTIEKKSLSLAEACLVFNISTASIIRNWQRKFREDGLTGLQSKPIGRPKTMDFKRKKRKSDKPLTREEELLRENEYLRAENELLKKFNALVQAEQAKPNKRLKP